MFAIIVSTALELSPFESYAVLVLTAIMFYLCHYEAYFTGSLLSSNESKGTIVLGKIVNPTEAQLGLVGMLLLTYAKGSIFWKDTQIYVGGIPLFSYFADESGMIKLNTLIVLSACLLVVVATVNQ